MFCKSLTMHPHLHKLWLAFSCVLWPGSKSTSCDDAGGPSVRKVARWCCSTMHYIEWCCKSLSWTLNIGTCNTACTCSCISLLQQLLTSLNSFEPLLSRRLFMKTCQICWDITCDGIEELHSRWTRFNLIELNTTGNCSVTPSALKPLSLSHFGAGSTSTFHWACTSNRPGAVTLRWWDTWPTRLDGPQDTARTNKLIIPSCRTDSDWPTKQCKQHVDILFHGW